MKKLEQRPFGAGGPLVSVLGLGTVKFGRNTDVKYPGGEGFPLPSDAQIEEILDLCLDHGLTLLDTAPAYGSSEDRLGNLMGQRREKFFLVTKTGEEHENGVSHRDFSPAYTRMSVERSLKRLKTDRLDCVIVHCGRNDAEILQGGVLDALEEMKAEGKLRFFGASIYTDAAVRLTLARGGAVMVEYHRDHDALAPAMQAARDAGCAVLVKKGLASGHAADKTDALRYAVAGPGVTSLVFGSLNPANILSNINALLKD